jgi:hypothetical protein
MPKKVLFIAYNWPPSNAAGTHRPLRFARHLRQFGWEPVVLAAEPPFYQRYDPNLLDRVPKDLEVVRAPHRDPWLSFLHRRAQRLARTEPQPGEAVEKNEASNSIRSHLRRRLKGTISWLECRLYHPDLYMRWIKSAVATALNNFQGSDFQAIFATANPWSDFEVGYQLSRRWDVPLILDFRDPWTISFYEFGDRRPAWARAWDRRRLARYLAAAQSVIFMHGGYAECYLSAYPNHLSDSKIHLIPHGFEPEDLCHIPPPQGNCLAVTYVGTLSCRKYDTLLSTLGTLVQRHNGNLMIKITFIGESGDLARQMIQKTALASYVEFLPTLPYEAANEVMKSSHALLLLGEQPSPGYELYVASKVFHYLSMQRPILGVMPPNEAKALLTSLRAGPLADVNSIPEIEAAILSLYQAWESGSLDRFLPPRQSLEKYMEPRMTGALARALSGQSPSRPYRRGEAAIPPSLQEVSS